MNFVCMAVNELILHCTVTVCELFYNRTDFVSICLFQSFLFLNIISVCLSEGFVVVVCCRFVSAGDDNKAVIWEVQVSGSHACPSVAFLGCEVTILT